MPPDVRDNRGCGKAPALIPVFDLDGQAYYLCPWRVITPETIELIRHYWFFKDGLLPIGGGLWDQTEIFIEGIEVLRAEFNARHEQESRVR